MQGQHEFDDVDGLGGNEDLAQLWRRAGAALEQQLGARAFDANIAPLGLLSAEGGVVRLSAPSAQHQRYVMEFYGTALRQAWAAVRPATTMIEVEVCAGPAVRPGAAGAAVAVEPADMSGEGAFGYRLRPECTFDRFVVGKANEFAYNAARQAAELGRQDYNPLVIYGNSGVGKTHLLHAITWEARRRRPDARVIFLSAESFMREFVRALRENDTTAFKDRLRGCDMLLVDDVQFLATKESTQAEFFHTFNSLIENGRQLVLSADKAPVDIENMAERVKSRLQWGLIAEIHPADYELRLGILQSKSEQYAPVFNIDPRTVPPRILEFLAQKIITNPRMLEGAMKRIFSNAHMTRRALTLDLVMEVIPDLLRASDKKVAIDDIQKTVCQFYNIRQSDMNSPRRSRVVVRPRHVAMYLSKKLTTRSLPEIGKRFGGRDHTTVIHAVRRIEEERKVDAALNEDLIVLQRMIEG